MNIEKIRERFMNRKAKPLDIKKEYAVLIPLMDLEGDLNIIYELRSKELNKQPGEISFPGGAVEPGESYEEAAVRETMEELNIGRENIEVLGEMDFLVSYADIVIYVYVGVIKGLNVNEILPSKAEVDHIFTVPLDFLLTTEPELYYLELTTGLNEEFPYNLIPNGKQYKWRVGNQSVYFYHYNEYNIWGFTAKVTKRFIDILNNMEA